MLGGDAFGMHASGSGGQVRGISSFALAQYWFEGLSGERGKGYWRLSTFSGGAFGRHAIGSGGQMRMTICFTPLTIPFPGARVGYWRFRWLPTLGGGASDMHASG